MLQRICLLLTQSGHCVPSGLDVESTARLRYLRPAARRVRPRARRASVLDRQVQAIYMRCEKRKIVRGAAIQSKREIQDTGKMPKCNGSLWERGQKTAKVLDITIPLPLSGRADELIE